MKNSRLLTILLAIAAALVLLAGAIALPILCRPFYYAHIGPLHLRLDGVPSSLDRGHHLFAVHLVLGTA